MCSLEYDQTKVNEAMRLGEEYLIIRRSGGETWFTDSFRDTLKRVTIGLISGDIHVPENIEDGEEDEYACLISIINHLKKYNIRDMPFNDIVTLTRIILAVDKANQRMSSNT